jgi:hypothetical protein
MIHHPLSLAYAAFIACTLVISGAATLQQPDRINLGCFLVGAAVLAFNVWLAVTP